MLYLNSGSAFVLIGASSFKLGIKGLDLFVLTAWGEAS